MKTVILAGGFGTRLAEHTTSTPKPMVEVGGRPMLWHVMQIYAAAGFKEFVVALGYRGEVIKQYFLAYHQMHHSLSIDLAEPAVRAHGGACEDWRVHLVDTGLATQTGGRVKRLAPHLDGERFMLTYGDGVSSVDIEALVAFHADHGRLATMLAVRPPARFGALVLDGDTVAEFTEKPQLGEGWINGGFFVLEPKVLDYIDGDAVLWEHEPLERLAKAGELMAYRHEGFWQCMDTLRDVRLLNQLCEERPPPWMR